MQIKLFLIVLATTLVLDKIWFSAYFGEKFMSSASRVQSLPNSQVRILYAVLSYLILSFGFWYFTTPLVANAKRENNLGKAILNSALFGFVMYGVFDMTNMAVFSKYELDVALLDMIWGAVLGGVVGFVLYKSL